MNLFDGDERVNNLRVVNLNEEWVELDEDKCDGKWTGYFWNQSINFFGHVFTKMYQKSFIFYVYWSKWCTQYDFWPIVV